MENKPPVKNMKMNTNNRTAAGWTVAILGAGFLMYKVRQDQMRKQAEEARQKVRDQPSTEPSETIPRAMKEQYRDTKGALKETGQEVKGKAQNVKNEVDIQADKDRLREEINKLQDRLDKNR